MWKREWIRVPLEFTILSLKLSRHVYVYMFFYWCNVTYLNSELESTLIFLVNVVTKCFRMTSMLRSVLWPYLLATRGKTTGRAIISKSEKYFLVLQPHGGADPPALHAERRDEHEQQVQPVTSTTTQDQDSSGQPGLLQLWQVQHFPLHTHQ